MDKKLYHIHNEEIGLDNFLRLTDNEYAFYKWLKNIGYLDEYTTIDYLYAMPTIIEF